MSILPPRENNFDNIQTGEGILRYSEKINTTASMFQGLSEASKPVTNEDYYSILINFNTKKIVKVNKKGEEENYPDKDERLRLIDAEIRHFLKYQDAKPPGCKSDEQADGMILGALISKREEIERSLGL